MYGNDTLPGVAVSETYRSKGSIWQGAPEATWFKTVNVNGSDDTAAPISAGTIMKELPEDGSYTPITADDITTDLPGARLAIVADKTAETGTAVLVGICGKVDRAKLLVGDTAFDDMTTAQQINLNTHLEAWGFMLVNVLQA